jgi:hypothetical protein
MAHSLLCRSGVGMLVGCLLCPTNSAIPVTLDFSAVGTIRGKRKLSPGRCFHFFLPTMMQSLIEFRNLCVCPGWLEVCRET